MEWPWQRRRREQEEAKRLVKKVAADLAMKRVHQRSEEIRREREQKEIERRTNEAELRLETLTEQALEESMRTRHALCSMCDSVGKGHVVRDGAIVCRACDLKMPEGEDEVVEVFELGSPTPVRFHIRRARDVSDEDLAYVRKSLGVE